MGNDFVNLLFQIMFQAIQLSFQILGLCLKTLFKVIGWITNEILKFSTSKLSHKDLVVLGTQDQMRPMVNYREFFDYSQLANRQEVSIFQNAVDGFWVGQYMDFRNNKPRVYEDIWIPQSFLQEHCLMVGLTGSGKTELLLKNISSLMQAGHIILVDATGDLAQRIQPIAQQVGSTLCYWGLDSCPQRITWNFLEQIQKQPKEQEIRAIAEAIYGNINDSDQNAAFWKRDIKWLTAIIAIAVEARRANVYNFQPSDLVSLSGDRTLIEEILNKLPHVKNQWGSDLSDYLSIPDDQIGRDIGFLQTKLSPFKDTDVKQICDGKSSLDLWKSLNSLRGNYHYTLVVGQSLASGKFGATLASIILRYLTNVMYRRMKNRQADWIPTYIICDEAPRLKGIDFKEFTAIGRNAKASIILMCQYIQDFGEQKEALNNCRTQILLQGVSDDTAEWFSKQLGEYQRKVMQLSAGGFAVGTGFNTQRNITSERAPILGIKELTSRPRNLPSKRSIIIRLNSSNSPTQKPFLTDYSN